MEQSFETKNGGFSRLMDFLFKDYPAWLWDKPNIFKFLIFPFLFFYKIFDVLVVEQGEKRFFYSRVYVASFLSIVLFFIIFTLIDTSKVQSQEISQASKSFNIELTGNIADSQETIRQQNSYLTQNYLLAGFLGCIIIIMRIFVFLKRKNLNLQNSEAISGNSEKTNYK